MTEKKLPDFAMSELIDQAHSEAAKKVMPKALTDDEMSLKGYPYPVRKEKTKPCPICQGDMFFIGNPDKPHETDYWDCDGCDYEEADE